MVKLFVFLRGQKAELGLQIEEGLKNHVLSPIPDGPLLKSLANAGVRKALEDAGWDRLSHSSFIRSARAEDHWIDLREDEREVWVCNVSIEPTTSTSLSLLIRNPSAARLSPFPVTSFANRKFLAHSQSSKQSAQNCAFSLPHMRSILVHDVRKEDVDNLTDDPAGRKIWQSQILFDLPSGSAPSHSLLISYDDERVYDEDDEDGQEGERVWLPSFLVLSPPGLEMMSKSNASSKITRMIVSHVGEFLSQSWCNSKETSEPHLNLSLNPTPMQLSLGFCKAGDLKQGPMNLSRALLLPATSHQPERQATQKEDDDEGAEMLLDVDDDEKKPQRDLQPSSHFLTRPGHGAERESWPALIKSLDAMSEAEKVQRVRNEMNKAPIAIAMRPIPRDRFPLQAPQIDEYEPQEEPSQSLIIPFRDSLDRPAAAAAPAIMMRKVMSKMGGVGAKGEVKSKELVKRKIEAAATLPGSMGNKGTNVTTVFKPYLPSTDLVPAAAKKRAKASDLDLSEVIKKVQEVHRSGKGLGLLTVMEMQRWCKERGLAVGGKKADLDARVTLALMNEALV